MRPFASPSTVHIVCPDERRSDVEVLLDGINSSGSWSVLAISEEDQGFSVSAEISDIAMVRAALWGIGAVRRNV